MQPRPAVAERVCVSRGRLSRGSASSEALTATGSPDVSRMTTEPRWSSSVSTYRCSARIRFVDGSVADGERAGEVVVVMDRVQGPPEGGAGGREVGGGQSRAGADPLEDVVDGRTGSALTSRGDGAGEHEGGPRPGARGLPRRSDPVEGGGLPRPEREGAALPPVGMARCLIPPRAGRCYEGRHAKAAFDPG